METDEFYSSEKIFYKDPPNKFKKAFDKLDKIAEIQEIQKE